MSIISNSTILESVISWTTNNTSDAIVIFGASGGLVVIICVFCGVWIMICSKPTKYELVTKRKNDF